MENRLRKIEATVLDNGRVSTSDTLFLFENGELGFLARLATHRRKHFNGEIAWFNRNFHIEPTNICIHNCLFCSYRKRIGQKDAWEMDESEILAEIRKRYNKTITEVHIVGGVHPARDLYYYAKLISSVHKEFPKLHIKAFTAVELDHMIRKSKLSYPEGLKLLKESGLGSIPGGGAEIFDEELREKICHDKTDSTTWLKIHEYAHQAGIPSNATMLYGHLEHYAQRVDHMNRLRTLQDKTNGFNVFIPLKYKHQNNELSYIGEIPSLEDLKNFAISRIFLDNIPHIKAYWPMIGKELATMSMDFGVDDLDGTIDDSTKIYSMAGAEDQNPALTTDELVDLIRKSGRQPVERDTLFNTVQRY